MTVRTAIIGTGFGESAMVPGLQLATGSEVAAICSGRLERAADAARRHGIAAYYDDYERMLTEVRPDLVCIATPTALHAPMTLAAIAAGAHVICEKPMALDRAESAAMLAAAEAAGVVHVIDHELRFNPTRVALKRALDAGYIGEPTTVSIRSVSALRADAQQAWTWWSDKESGGGALGANGSHQVDLLRWWFGDVTAVSGQLATCVKQRPLTDGSGEQRAVTSDDQFSLIARMTSGMLAHVFVSYVAHHGGGNQIEVHGSAGSLVIDQQERLWGKRIGQAVEELTPVDPLAEEPRLANNLWARAFAHLAAEVVDAIRSGRAVRGAATFRDGLRCQEVLDAVRRSDAEQRWITLEN